MLLTETDVRVREALLAVRNESPELQALIQVHGSDWDGILCRIYLAGGKVVYRQKGNGKYEAACTVVSA